VITKRASKFFKKVLAARSGSIGAEYDGAKGKEGNCLLIGVGKKKKVD